MNMIKLKRYYMCQKSFWNDSHNKAMESLSNKLMCFRDLSKDIAQAQPNLYSQRISGELNYKTIASTQQPSDIGFRLTKRLLRKQAQQIKDFIEQMKNSVD